MYFNLYYLSVVIEKPSQDTELWKHSRKKSNCKDHLRWWNTYKQYSYEATVVESKQVLWGLLS